MTQAGTETEGGASSASVRRVGPAHAAESLAILREVASWLIERGDALWQLSEFREAEFAAAAAAGELILGFAGDRAVATMLLQSVDGLYWPEAPAGSALYVHKVGVRRAFAAQGWPGRLIDFAVAEARRRGIARLRLDTVPRPPLQSLYERYGFTVLAEEPLLIQGRRIIRMERIL